MPGYRLCHKVSAVSGDYRLSILILQLHTFLMHVAVTISFEKM